uniref:alpha-amylase n=1 Tax=Timema cristinae TaxID=61476 RepID=A0A7R9CHE2_TIMCR|nr:unnamed protein product [Timema cristinae]
MLLKQLLRTFGRHLLPQPSLIPRNYRYLGWTFFNSSVFQSTLQPVRTVAGQYTNNRFHGTFEHLIRRIELERNNDLFVTNSSKFLYRKAQLVGLHAISAYSSNRSDLDIIADPAQLPAREVGPLEVKGKIKDLYMPVMVDAVKHMSPSDLGPIYDAVKNLSSVNGFKDGARPFFYQEVIDLGGEGISRYEYNQLGRITEFRFGAELSRAFRGQNAIKWLKNFGPKWGLLPSEDAVVFIDNHDTQRTSGNNILTYKDPKLYKMAVAFMLSWSYGFPRIMSSFAFQNSDTGPPHDEKQNILSVPIKEDETCGNDWVCEHRWRQIYNMVKFRNIVRGTSVKNWWDNRSKQIAFCRGNKGFIAFNDELNTVFRQHLQTCLPSGTYCDIISGSKLGDVCSGKSVVVDNLGEAEITIIATEQDGVLAIHAEV